jgi:hypothetical protein
MERQRRDVVAVAIRTSDMATLLRHAASKTGPRAKASRLLALLVASISGSVVWNVLDQSPHPARSNLMSSAFAQDNDTTGSGTRGAAGWNGGSRDVQPAPGTPQDLQRGAGANDPLYATGIDLKGPSVRYGPDRAPE